MARVRRVHETLEETVDHGIFTLDDDVRTLVDPIDYGERTLDDEVTLINTEVDDWRPSVVDADITSVGTRGRMRRSDQPSPTG